MSPKIAIITTTYNQEKYISQTIESILSQSYSDWELFIGDDGSVDQTYEVALGYAQKDTRIHLWKNNPNLGIVGNMLSLIEKVDSIFEYVAFLEGDDLYTSENLAQKIQIFDKYPQVRLVYSDMSFIDARGDLLQEKIFHYRNVKFYQNTPISKEEFILHRMGPISSWSTCMIKKSVLDEFGIVQIIDRRDAGDLHFYFQIATKYHVYGIDEPLTLYRRHENNTSRPDGGITTHMERQMEYYREHGIISKKLFYKKLSWIYVTYAVLDLERGEKRKAVKNTSKSFSYSFFSDVHYKIAIIILCLLPQRGLSYIMKKIIKRS